jgi:hypothetical protein
MSEYQYYQFQAVDRPLTDRQMKELRAISTRAEITPTSFVNAYHWGSLKADPFKLVQRYFDAHLYVANWGTRCLMLKVPRELVDVRTAGRYKTNETMFVRANKKDVVFVFESNDEEGEDWDSGEGWLASLLPLRDDLMQGDLRSLYLGWLSGICQQSDAMEPPVPPGMGRLSGSLQALADFLRLDARLLAAAAQDDTASPPGGPSSGDLADWVARLAASEKDDLIAQLISGEEHPSHLLAPLRQRFQEAWSRANRLSSPAAAQPGRTAGQLFEAAKASAEQCHRRDTERKARAEAKRQRTEAAKRKAYLEELAPKAETIWRKVESLLQTTIRRDYDQAVKWLRDLRDLAQTSLPSKTKTWEERVRGLRRQHARKPSLLKRFDDAGFPR